MLANTISIRHFGPRQNSQQNGELSLELRSERLKKNGMFGGVFQHQKKPKNVFVILFPQKYKKNTSKPYIAQIEP